MKHSFNCFYDTTETKELDRIWKDDDTLFIFDTNVLLSLYSFQSDSRKDFLKVLASIQDRIWIPFHVGLEFQKNRLTIIKNRRNTFNDLKKSIDKLADTVIFEKKPFTTLQNEFSLKKNYPGVSEKLNDTLEKISSSFSELKDELKNHLKQMNDEVNLLDSKRIFVNSEDYIRDEIDLLFIKERVGENTFDTLEKLNALYKEGGDRYKNKIPPGYEDESKGEDEFFFDGIGYKRKFGDLIIFKQIIEFSKKKSTKNVIFVSEDIKKDWRYIEDQGGDKILGARFELKRELYNEAGVENFFIYQIEDFVKKTNEFLDIKIEDKTLKSIKLSLEEDKHQRSLENFMNKSDIHKTALEAQKKVSLYDRAVENSYSKAVLDAREMADHYNRATENSYTKAVLDAQKMHHLYDGATFNAHDQDSAYAKGILEAQKMYNLYNSAAFNAYDQDSTYAKALLEAQKMHNLYDSATFNAHDQNSTYAKVVLEAQKRQHLYDQYIFKGGVERDTDDE